MLVFVAFRRLAGLEASRSPEPLLMFAAILPWQFFSTALSESSISLIGNANLISKVYFPRLIVPTAAVVTTLVDFAITFGLLGLLMAWYGFPPDWRLTALPLYVLEVFGLAVGTGALMSALNVEYRDFRYIVPFVVQFGLFVSPVAFTLRHVPEQWRTLYSLNPMVGIIEGFRWSILRGDPPLDLRAAMLSAVVTTAFLWAGVWYFRRMERSFADVI